MCLGVPGKVLAVDGNIASVDFWGVTRQVRLDVVDEPVDPGDYVLNHVGYAIRRIPHQEAQKTLELYQELLASHQQELMAEDVQGELKATKPAPTEES